MPEKLERALKSQARKKGLKGDRANAYVYGTLRKTGWKPDRGFYSHMGSNCDSFYNNVGK